MAAEEVARYQQIATIESLLKRTKNVTRPVSEGGRRLAHQGSGKS